MPAIFTFFAANAVTCSKFCGMTVPWHDGIGMSLYAKRLERGRFIWPSPADGIVAISAAQLAYMLDGIDWRTRFAPGGRRWLDNTASF
jgi:transposase